jgi:hypothetical protein
VQIQEQSRSRRLLDHFVRVGLEPDTFYSYDSLSAVIEAPIQKNRSSVYQVIRWLEKFHHRTLVCVEGKGYRVARSNESPDIAAVRHKRAIRQIRKGRHTLDHTDTTALTQAERVRLDMVRSGTLALERDLVSGYRSMQGDE